MKFLKEGFDVFVIARFEVWLQNFGPIGVCQEDVLENLIGENYKSNFDKTKAQRRAFVASIVR